MGCIDCILEAVTIANDFEGREVVSLGFFFENCVCYYHFLESGVFVGEATILDTIGLVLSEFDVYLCELCFFGCCLEVCCYCLWLCVLSSE